jgi:hypothetical protein
MLIMPKNRSVFAIAVLVAAFFAGGPVNAAENARETREFAAQTVRRPHIVIHPRHLQPGPNSKRICRFWLAQEYRVSGPVIVPQQQCRWR